MTTHLFGDTELHRESTEWCGDFEKIIQKIGKNQSGPSTLIPPKYCQILGVYGREVPN